MYAVRTIDEETTYIRNNVGTLLRWKQLATFLINFTAALVNMAISRFPKKIIKMTVGEFKEGGFPKFLIFSKLIAAQVYAVTFLELTSRTQQIKEYVNSKVKNILSKLYDIETISMAYYSEKISTEATNKIIKESADIHEKVINESLQSLYQRIQAAIENEVTYLKIQKESIKNHILSVQSTQDLYNNWIEFWKQQEPGREERHTNAQRQIENGIRIRDRWLENVQTNALEFTQLHQQKELEVLNNLDKYVPDCIIKEGFMLQINQTMNQYGADITKVILDELEEKIKEIIIEEAAKELRTEKPIRPTMLKKKTKRKNN